jgi:hypothetical protein
MCFYFRDPFGFAETSNMANGESPFSKGGPRSGVNCSRKMWKSHGATPSEHDRQMVDFHGFSTVLVYRMVMDGICLDFVIADDST